MSKDIGALVNAFRGFPRASQWRVHAVMYLEMVKRDERPEDLVEMKPNAPACRLVIPAN